MDFTREPIIETVITPREGFKLVVRSSKSVGQEEYFVDAVEVVTFGSLCFYRSLEKPKAFIVPASDYEVLEVREARIVLKNVGLDKSIKIGGGKEQPPRYTAKEPIEAYSEHEEKIEQETTVAIQETVTAPKSSEPKERKRDRRRHYRRRRGREEGASQEEADLLEKAELGEGEEKIVLSPPSEEAEHPSKELQESINAATSLLSSLLTPPPMLISETLAKYKNNELFRGAFYERSKPEEELGEEGMGEPELLDDSFPTEADEVRTVVESSITELTLEEKLQAPEPPVE